MWNLSIAVSRSKQLTGSVVVIKRWPTNLTQVQTRAMETLRSINLAVL